jgi:capsular polysaccharide biosynthesis protein
MTIRKNVGRYFRGLICSLPSKLIRCRAISSKAYARRFNAKWHPIYSAFRAPSQKPNHYGDYDLDLVSLLDTTIPEVGVLEVQDVILYGKAGWIITKSGHHLTDHSWYRGYKPPDVPPLDIQKIRTIPGKCLYLSSDFAINNYGHQILDSYSRFHLFDKAGFKIDDIDHVFCPKPLGGSARAILSKLKIPLQKCIWADTNTALRVDYLIAPTFPGIRRCYPPWVPSFLKETLSPSVKLTGRKLFISRVGSTRNIHNEGETHALMQKYGFEIYHPSADQKSYNDFASATFIVGVSGAGMADLAFCCPGTCVIEIIPTDHVYPYYFTLSSSAGLNYSYMAGVSVSHRGNGAFGPSTANVKVDINTLEHAVRQMLSDRTSSVL